MRRAFAALIAGAALLALTACGSGGESALDPLRARLEAAAGLEITADVSSAAEGRYSEYTLRYERGADGGTVTVLSPETLAGVSASFDSGSALLSYDGLALSFELPGEVSPVTALPLLADALAGAYETLSWTEGGDTFVSLEATDSLGATVRLDAEGAPVWAELLVDGVSAAECEITQFLISEA